MRKQIASFILAIFALVNTWVIYKAFAATAITNHLTPGCANNGDGTAAGCAASGGAAGAYNTFSNAITGIQTLYPSFVASDVIVTLLAHTGTAVDSQAGSITINATMDATRYLIIQTSGVDRSNGLYQGYRLSCGGSVDQCILIDGTAGTKVVIDGLAFKETVPDGSGRGATVSLTNNTYAEISNCFFWYAQSSGTANTSARNSAIDGDSAALIVKAKNNIIYNYREGIHIRSIFQTSSDYEIDSNTIVDSRAYNLHFEMDGSSDTLGVYDNLLKGGTTADFLISSSAATYNHLTNSTSDTSSPDGGSFQSKTFTFVNSASQDYHLTAGDTGAKGLGTNCATSCTGYVFTDDIDGGTRAAPWDNGADQIGATATPTPTPTATASACHKAMKGRLCRKAEN